MSIDRTITEKKEEDAAYLERAVDKCFRLIGGANMTFRKAVAYVADNYAIPEAELMAAYTKAVNIACESD